jgi:SAM-dependent methyltransferase
MAREFIGWLDLPPGLHWLEVGCGTGALTGTILDLAEPASILACDPSEAFVELARGKITDSRATFAVAAADNLPKSAQPPDVCVSGLALNFIPEPKAALEGMARRLAPDAVIGAYVWDYADGMEFLRIFWDAAADLDPAAEALHEGRRFPLCAPWPLRALFLNLGLKDVTVQPLTIPTRFRDFSDFWEPLLGASGPAPAYVQTLDTESRRHLKESLEKRFPIKGSESVDLTARAWAVRGLA